MKTLLTANEVNAARKAGQTSIRLPQDALITPQARDDAREYGIALVRGGEGRNSEGKSAPAAGAATPPASARMGSVAPPATPASFIHRGAGLTLAKRKELPTAPAGLAPTPGALNLIEALVPAKGQPGAGYMRWESGSFAWTFEQAHILVVLEGELELRLGGGEVVIAEPGDTLRLEAGLSVTMVAKGRVCCAYASWMEI